jgi:hypothetical protein
MRQIPLTNGGYAVVDNVDYVRLTRHRWYRHPKGHAQRSVNVGGRVRTIYMHREIVGAPASHQVDHKDRNKLNNRRRNLRLATNGQNQRNREKQAAAASCYKGVGYKLGKNTKPWYARLSVDKTRIHLGYFADEVTAAAAYNAAAAARFGEFARLNRIPRRA